MQEGLKKKPNASEAILHGGLLSGFADLTAACVSSYSSNGVTPVRVFQSIASGLLGKASSEGGAATAILGIFLHFVIAFIWTTIYYLASRKLSFLIKQAEISGVIYGIAVYGFMQLVVLPLSAFPYKKQLVREPGAFAGGMLIHIFCIGLPIALMVRHYSRTDR